MAQMNEILLNRKLDYLDDTKELFKEVLLDLGAEISDDDTFRDYADKIKDLDLGDVLLFATEEEMNEYPNPKEDTLAIIYRQSQNLLGLTPEYIVTFPDTVTLQDECVSNYNETLLNKSVSNTGNIYLTPTYCNINIYSSDYNINVGYRSEDGIHYTLEYCDLNYENISNTAVDIPDGLRFRTNGVGFTITRNFIEYTEGYFGGIFKCVNGVFVRALSQFNLTNSNQLLTGYTAYGSNGMVQGDGTYITNIPIYEYVREYFPSLYDNGFITGVIQTGTQVKAMDYVQRKQIRSDEAFDNDYPQDNAVVQIADTRDVTTDVPDEYRTIIQNYSSAQTKYNYAFFIGDVAYRLYIGYNYSTKQQQNVEGEWFTVPYQMTAIYGFIVNLEDLSIYKTFQNTDSWTFTNNGFGNLLTYEYSIKSDCLVLLCDMHGWGNTNGAYMSITTIKAGTGVRNTNYFTVNYSGDYSFKSITYTSYDYEQDCYYLAYHTFQSSSEGGAGSTKRICKLTPSGTLTSIYESSEDMKYIYSLWTKYFKNIDSLICYTTTNKGTVLRNLNTGNEIMLYGTTITNSNVWGLDNENIYFSHKTSNNDENYNIYRINRKTLNAEIIPDTESTYRITNAFYTYNRDLCVFYNNQIISLQGEVLAKFMKALLNNPSISGIDRINEYMYRASFADYNLQISYDKFTAKLPTYTYFEYSDITELPIKNDLCLVANDTKSMDTNDIGRYYKYQSLIVTDVARSNEELYERISELQNQLDLVNAKADIIRGEN